MFNKSFEEMGVPAGYGFRQMLFNPSANFIVIQTNSTGRPWRPERLFFRHVASLNYRSVGAPGDLTSQEYPFVHPAKPLLAYNAMLHRFIVEPDGKERLSGNWESLSIFDLETGTEVAAVTPSTLRLPSGIVRGWIASIVAFSDEGLFVTAGLSEDAARMDYFVSHVDYHESILKPIAALPATFI